MINEPFDPWRAVAESDNVVLSFHPIARLMGGGFYARRGEIGLIVIDPDLRGADRRAVMTHELIHHERADGLSPIDPSAALASFVAADERCVDREVARRLVPRPSLEAFVRSSTRAGLGVGAAEVAEHFEVPASVATCALDELRSHPRRTGLAGGRSHRIGGGF